MRLNHDGETYIANHCASECLRQLLGDWRDCAQSHSSARMITFQLICGLITLGHTVLLQLIHIPHVTYALVCLMCTKRNPNPNLKSRHQTDQVPRKREERGGATLNATTNIQPGPRMMETCIKCSMRQTKHRINKA